MRRSIPMLALFLATPAVAQRRPAAPVTLPARVAYDSSLFNALEWREVGPFRGGRSTAVTGVVGQPYVFYFGGTGGGVWKTTDGGMTWSPVSDSAFTTGSIGAIAVSASDPNVVFVGTGESPIRGNVSPGDGMYKSTDAGKTWAHLGLRESQQISTVRIHPTNPDLVYVAALGHVWAPNSQRGIYRSKDGGKTFDRVLFKNDSTGAIDLAMDPSNPRVLYAALWQAGRTPWALSSGGAGSGLWKSTDGGDTWRDLTRNPGLPKGVVGKIGVTVSAVNPDRVWAIVEADDGGVYRSEDAGDTWTKLNEDRRLRQRAWYYTEIFADPKDPETVYVENTSLYRSVDGGRTYVTVDAPHGDNHDLWIDPQNPQRMINANDGGATVTYNGGVTWSTVENQPTAQFYHVTTTSDFPYKLCGAQQDNTTVCIASRANGGIQRTDWYEVGGCESGYIASRPDNPDVSYAGCYGGYLDRHDRRTGEDRNVMAWPDNPMGWAAGDLKYRFQWTYPIVLSPLNPHVLYASAQVLFKSVNEGQSWTVI
ncbi:MAG TPA: glycosyl hydrolase, partial [Gemmatimonadales bacterium]